MEVTAAAVYLDDILVWGTSAVEVAARAAYVRDRIVLAGGEINARKRSEGPLPRVTYLGVEFDVATGRYRSGCSWGEKAVVAAVSILRDASPSVRSCWKLFGIAFRVAHVRQTRLCVLRETLSTLQGAAQRLHEGSLTWEDPFVLSPATRDELAACVDAMRVNDWLSLRREHPRLADMAVWSDASTTGWGAVVSVPGGADSQVAHGVWAREGQSGDMFVLELLAAEKAIRLALDLGSRTPLLAVDNQAVECVLRKGHSRVRFANVILQRIFGMLGGRDAVLGVHWIPTADMPADSWSRAGCVGATRCGRESAHVVERESGFAASSA